MISFLVCSAFSLQHFSIIKLKNPEFPLLEESRQKLVEFYHMVTVYLVPVIINDDIPLADWFFDLQKLYLLVLNTSPQ